MTTPRNRSLKYQDHAGLLTKLAKKYHARLAGARVIGVEYGDVEGELGLAFTKAAQGFNPDAGWTFTAFLTQCCQNHFNKYARRLILEQYGVENPIDPDGETGYSASGVGYVSVEDLGTEEGSLFDLMESDTFADPEATAEASSILRDIVNDETLSTETRVYISLLANPAMHVSEPVRERIRGAEIKIRRELKSRFGTSCAIKV